MLKSILDVTDDAFNIWYFLYYSYIEFLTSKGTMEIDHAGIKTMMEIDRAGIKACKTLQHVHHTHNHAGVAGLHIMLIGFSVGRY